MQRRDDLANSAADTARGSEAPLSLRIAYITSVKRGLASFVYKEIDHVVKGGAQVVLFATKYGAGLYMPKPAWPAYILNRTCVILRQPVLFARWPRKYLALLGTAFRTQTLIDFLIGFDFASAMKAHGVTSIHCNEGLHSLNIGFYCHQVLGLPLTVTIYADALYVPPSPAMFRMALGSCAAVITVCDYNRDLLVKDFGVATEKVHVVRLHVDTDQFRPRQRVSVLIVGQFAERKGHEILLRALQFLGRDDVVAWVVGGRLSGGGDDYVDVPRLASQLGVEDRVVFFGNVSEEVLKAIYQACDIFCLPSRFRFVREGTPVSLMEAMATGRPVISTRHAGIPEYVEQVLVGEDDVEGLARAIGFLADHPEIREAQGKRNREIAQAKFSTKNIDDLIAVFREVESDIPRERV